MIKVTMNIHQAKTLGELCPGELFKFPRVGNSIYLRGNDDKFVSIPGGNIYPILVPNADVTVLSGELSVREIK